MNAYELGAKAYADSRDRDELKDPAFRTFVSGMTYYQVDIESQRWLDGYDDAAGDDWQAQGRSFPITPKY